MTIVRWNCRSPLPVKKTSVRVTALGARYFELLRSGYSEPEALSIATSEHGPQTCGRVTGRVKNPSETI
jgi:hypothetical protein